jgi:hypothetical protein
MQAEHSFNSPALIMQGRLFVLGNLFCGMMKQVVRHIHQPSISLIFELSQHPLNRVAINLKSLQ